MSTEREELIKEANTLDLEFHSNIPTGKLKTLIEEKKNTSEDPPEIPKDTSLKVKTGKSTKVLTLRDKIKKAKERALKLVVVTITNKDNRENDVMTTAPLSFENQYFGLSRDVPLDISVEIEQALIDVAESTMMTLHKDEIVDGKRTGNKVPVTVKKYAISYGKPQED